MLLDIEQLLPYLSKNIKAMGLNTEGVLTYDDIINHLKQYKSNQFTFFIDEFNTNIIYQNDSVCVIEGSFILHMEEYQATTQYFYSICFIIFNSHFLFPRYLIITLSKIKTIHLFK